MKKLKIIMIIIISMAATAILIFRAYYMDAGEMLSREFTVQGIKSGIAIEAGDTLEGVFISFPSFLNAEEVISVSSDTDVAYLILDRNSIGEDRVIKASVKAVSEGIAEIYVCSADGSVVSEKYAVNIVVTDTGVCQSDNATTPSVTELNDTVVVYITPTGSKYHLQKSCAGENGGAVSLEDAVLRGYQPCKSCAVYK